MVRSKYRNRDKSVHSNTITTTTNNNSTNTHNSAASAGRDCRAATTCRRCIDAEFKLGTPC